MDTQVKYRLTGAIILVVIMVLVVPELLSGPEEGRQPTAVAGEEAPLRSYTIDLSDDVRTGTLQPAQPEGLQPAANGSVSAAPSRAEEREAEIEAPQDGDTLEDVGPVAGEGDVLEAPAPLQRPSVAPVPAPKPAVSPAPTPVPHTPAAAPGSGWAVQVGSFASRANADKLARQLQTKGFRTSVSLSGGSRKLYRVRVGPAPDRGSAQALAMRLKAAGQSGSIVPHP